ncbi:MAG: DUF367 family protein [Nitrososphaerota archaeon]|jgi:pre-rRNA-processing protein TSR3|nr:DUF367 family protein [Nitrososphaerota archaeon]
MLTKTPRLFVIHFHQDDPHKCTAEKLRRLSLVKFVQEPRGLILQPFAYDIISPKNDSNTLSITALDLSWNKSDSWNNIFSGTKGRRLPFLLAANPTNYSKPNLLSTAEALAGALFILGFIDQSLSILKPFKWGHTFYQLNEKALNIYSTSSNIRDTEIYIKSKFNEIFKID